MPIMSTLEVALRLCVTDGYPNGNYRSALTVPQPIFEIPIPEYPEYKKP